MHHIGIDSTKAMSNKGSIDIGCGSYSYEIQNPPPPPPPTSTEAPPAASPTATCFFQPPQPGSGSSQMTIQFHDASPAQILTFQQMVGCARGGSQPRCALEPENCSASPPDLVGDTTLSYLQSGGAATLPTVSCAKAAIAFAIGQNVECTRGP